MNICVIKPDFVVRKNIADQLNKSNMSFVVIEGLDGSGKSTQLNNLCSYLDGQNINYRYIHFPRIDSSLFGSLIAMFLRGDLGSIDTVNPYLAALLYAGNRNDAKKEISGWLSDKYLVIADRYVYSNIAYQCSKLTGNEEKKQLKSWILHLEYEHYGIPRPDINIFLDVPMGFTRKNLENSRTGNDREYLGGKEDIHEKSIPFQEKVRREYLDQDEIEHDIKVLNCYDKQKKILKTDEITKKLISLLRERNII